LITRIQIQKQLTYKLHEKLIKIAIYECLKRSSPSQICSAFRRRSELSQCTTTRKRCATAPMETGFVENIIYIPLYHFCILW
jgi:hypothetical protein